jgi:hypothetical protein
MISSSGIGWEAGAIHSGVMKNGEEYNGGSLSSQSVSAPGYFQYQDSSNLDARVNDRFTRNTYQNYENGAIVQSDLSLDDASANVTDQHAWSNFGGYVTQGEITNAEFINNANLSHGQIVNINGTSMYTSDMGYAVRLGTGGNDSSIDYQNNAENRYTVVTNESGFAQLRPELVFVDFNDSWASNSTGKAEANQTINSTVNQT